MDMEKKEQVLNILMTVKQSMEYLKNNFNMSEQLIMDSCDALRAVMEFIKANNEKSYVKPIEKLLGKLKKISEVDIKKDIDILISAEEDLSKIINNIDKIIDGRIKVLFLSYKLSMWTSLESVWKAADEDENCEAVVIPIPYHELDNDLNKVNICYDGETYPENIPVTKFWEYNISKEKPDMIFIHNPYDDRNSLTQVEEEYYSRNLKKYTNMLVYIPYATNYIYRESPKRTLYNVDSEGVQNADRVIVENDGVKRKYEEKNKNKGKILALGSPKFDPICDIRNNGMDYIGEWKGKIENKTVFLLITTLSYYTRRNTQSLEQILEVYTEVTKRKDCILIWRPHPLEEEWLRNKNPELYELYCEIKKMFIKNENVFIDTNEEYKTTLNVANAIFSPSTSLINEVMVLGKPLYMLEKIPQEDGLKHLIDIQYLRDCGKGSVSEYIDSIISGEGMKAAEDMAKIANERVCNLENGDCGKKVYETLKKELLEYVF